VSLFSGSASGLGLPDPERENALLVGIIDAISSGPSLGPLAGKVASLIVSATGTDVCFVYVLDDSGGALTLTGATPPFDGQVGKIRLPVGEGVTGWVASHRAPAVITAGKEADPRYRYFPELGGREYTSMVSVPMESGLTGLVGVLNVHTRERREFTERDVRLLSSIGALVAGAVHQARLHRRLAAKEQAAERLAEQLIAAQEAERRRLAGEIHDGITQRLVSLAYHLDAAAAAAGGELAADGGSVATELARARELTDLTLAEAHAALAGLRPPVLEDLGLGDALASLARSIGQLPVTVDAADGRLPEHMEVALYRIAQEALQNVVKHAHASAASVSLCFTGDRAVLRVTDDGRGFDVAAASRPDDSSCYGLASMAERAELIGGRLDVTSRPGLGTTVTASVPLASLPAQFPQPGIVDAEVVRDLVDDGPPDLFADLVLGPADRADGPAVDRDAVGQHPRVAGRRPVGERDPLVEPEQAARSGAVLDGHGDVAHQLPESGRQPVQRRADHLFETLWLDVDHQTIVGPSPAG
jgi:two-component system, NarL family, sensor kinase